METAFLIAGLLAARQYFDRDREEERALREKIDALWRAVEWDWYTQGVDVLYWHWSPTHAWAMNHAIRGWNECLVAYVLAAGSPTHAIDPEIYHRGWASGPHFKNGTRLFRHAAAARAALWRAALLHPLFVPGDRPARAEGPLRRLLGAERRAHVHQPRALHRQSQPLQGLWRRTAGG